MLANSTTFRGQRPIVRRVTAALACTRCSAELRLTAKFCDECGSPTAAPGATAEYQQVTVLFAELVIRLGGHLLQA